MNYNMNSAIRVRKKANENNNGSNKTNTRNMPKTLSSNAQKESTMTSNIQQKRLETTATKKIEPYVNNDQKGINKPKMDRQKTTEKIDKIQQKVECHLSGIKVEFENKVEMQKSVDNFSVKQNPDLNASTQRAGVSYVHITKKVAPEVTKQNVNMPNASKQNTQSGNVLKKVATEATKQNAKMSNASKRKTEPGSVLKKATTEPPSQNTNIATQQKVTKLPASKLLPPDIPLPDKNKNIDSQIKKPSKSSKAKKADIEDEKQREKCPKGKVSCKHVWRDLMTKFHKPKWEDITKSLKFKVTTSLIEILHDGEIKYTAYANAKQSVKAYLNKHPFVIVQLIKVIEACNSLPVCSSAATILHQVFIKSRFFTGNSVFDIMKYLKSAENFVKLVNSVSTIEIRFGASTKFKTEAPVMYGQILEIIVGLCGLEECKVQLRKITRDAILFMCKLLREQHNNELLVNILLLFKSICIQKKSCQSLSCPLFYDSLCSSYKRTQKLITIVAILKLMAKKKSALQCMSQHFETINLLLRFVNYNSRTSASKDAVLTILHRVATTESGLQILCTPANYKKLYQFFVKNKSIEEIESRVKAYSILSLCTKKTVLPISKLHMELNLSPDIMKCVEERQDLADTNFYNESDDDSSETDTDCDGLSSSSSKVMTEQMNNESLHEMKVFFREMYESQKEFNVSKFSIFNENGGTAHDVIVQRVHRLNNLNRLAFPDAAMIIPKSESDKNCVSKFPLEHLLKKLNVKDNNSNEPRFTPQVVYNLDELWKTKEPADIPDLTFKPQSESLKGITGPLKFESRFECGNLRRVTQIDKLEYNLMLTPDTYTSKGFQWFYFQTSNMMPGEIYIFNIINLTKTQHLFNEGMQPVMFSVTDYKLNGTGWKRGGERVVYYGNHYTNKSGSIQYKTLSFGIVFPYKCDYVYMAYHYPYTYTRLMVGLAPFVEYKSYSISARLDKLCGTINDNNDVPLLTITASLDCPDSLKIPLNKRPVIFITARVHPGESNASWIMEGIINYLLNETEEYAVTAREHYIFKIIPMLNPEGVIYGNTRRGLVGLDLNRCWAKPNKVICPEIYYAKRLIEYAKLEMKQPVAAFIDIHGHSQEKFFFFYGCNPKKSWKSEDHMKGDYVESLELLPQTIQKQNLNIQLSNCKYEIAKSRESTGRVVMWRELGITQSYTLECSYSEGYRKQTINTKILTEIGESVVAALGRIARSLYKSRKTLITYGLEYGNMDNWPSGKEEEEHLSADGSSSDTAMTGRNKYTRYFFRF